MVPSFIITQHQRQTRCYPQTKCICVIREPSTKMELQMLQGQCTLEHHRTMKRNASHEL
ncbi:hypothetical protein DPMN_165430 [Dreissena polymorpha]|uniref:Uncharacterized protein n=1 Tax=Dreissena polymorpha TaxID=45954 RepID=A0A9D4IWD7_DREPO|nr:hypothetical protein DPMN_165430 [Dreissena polymorpha]